MKKLIRVTLKNPKLLKTRGVKKTLKMIEDKLNKQITDEALVHFAMGFPILVTGGGVLEIVKANC